MSRCSFAALAAVVVVSPATAQSLDIGDAAPALHADTWVQGQPVDPAAADSLVLVEFWATWCGPCIDSIPHLTELQTHYGPRGLTVVGITARDPDNALDKVKAFVKDRADSIGYSIAFEEQDKTKNAYMTASGSMGIPTAFLASKGRIAWIGHPMNLTHDTLDAVIAGTYDLEVARRRRALDTQLMEAYWGGDWDKARDTVIEITRLDPEDGTPYVTLFEIYADRLEDVDAARAAGKKAVTLLADDPIKLAEAASTIAREDDPHEYNTLARKAITKALAAAPDEPKVLMAHFRVLMAMGHLEQATVSADKAIALLDGNGRELGMIAAGLAAPDSPGRCHELALKAIERAITAEPGELAHLQTKFRILWNCRKDRAAAEKVGLYLVDKAGPRDAGLLNAFAWNLLTEESTAGTFNRLALAAAERCDRVSGGDNWMFVDTLALAQFENDLIKEAVASEMKAMKLCPADHPAQASLKEALERFEKGKK